MAIEIHQALETYDWYHPVNGYMSTPGWRDPDILRTQAITLSALASCDLKGKRILDVGCRDGLFSFAAERQGAGEIVGIDNQISLGAKEFLIPYFKSRVQMHEVNVYDLTKEQFGTFDVIICSGVLYHLRFPFFALKRISDVLKLSGLLVLETAVWVDDNTTACCFCPVGAESPYEPTCCTFFNTKGLTDTLKSFGLQARQIQALHNHQQQRGKPRAILHRYVRRLLGLPTWSTIDRATFTCQLMPVDMPSRPRRCSNTGTVLTGGIEKTDNRFYN